MAHGFGRAVAVFGARRDTSIDQPAPRMRKIFYGPLPIGGNDGGSGGKGIRLRIGLHRRRYGGLGGGPDAFGRMARQHHMKENAQGVKVGRDRRWFAQE